ncbi:MAG: BolA/IbaG family iron-sulfur metabolism protein [Gammaproteobacteria bacterium]|nr:BolA/IbaG family iron-sulfur metabolism protein [Gammaproteobacteria bacterium]
MSVQQQIEQKLQEAFQPEFMEVLNESGNHNVPAGSESHFKVTLVSDRFDGEKLIGRHRLVNSALKDEMDIIHALALHTYSPGEWNERGQAPDSPQCLGGGK